MTQGLYCSTPSDILQASGQSLHVSLIKLLYAHILVILKLERLTYKNSSFLLSSVTILIITRPCQHYPSNSRFILSWFQKPTPEYCIVKFLVSCYQHVSSCIGASLHDNPSISRITIYPLFLKNHIYPTTIVFFISLLINPIKLHTSINHND